MGPQGENMSPDQVAAEVVELREEVERLRNEADSDKDEHIAALEEEVEHLKHFIRDGLSVK